MKNKKICTFIIGIIILILLVACSKSTTMVETNISSVKSTGKIYLYGEQHGVENILKRELELWGEYYHNENMRHLFIEMPYYSTEFLNFWMQSDNDDIMEELYKDLKGTAAYNPYTKEFYEKIKEKYPETIFHGTDVGHQYHTTGERFLKYLEENKLENTDKYLLAQESIEQGEYYYKNSDDIYRENKMVENFIREFDKLENKNIMGIYGGAHTDFDAMAYRSKSTPSMANQLKERYGDNIYSEDLSPLAKEIDPIRLEKITINEKDYEASYFGKQDLTGFKDYSYRKFWRLENTYEYFKDKEKTGNVLPYNNYPMSIDTGQVFVIDYIKKNGSVEREYYRSDGYIWDGMPSTEEFIVE